MAREARPSIPSRALAVDANTSCKMHLHSSARAATLSARQRVGRPRRRPSRAPRARRPPAPRVGVVLGPELGSQRQHVLYPRHEARPSGTFPRSALIRGGVGCDAFRQQHTAYALGVRPAVTRQDVGLRRQSTSRRIVDHHRAVADFFRLSPETIAFRVHDSRGGSHSLAWASLQAGAVSQSYGRCDGGLNPACPDVAPHRVPFMQNVVPRAGDDVLPRTITLPKSSAPNRSATCPTSGPCVTQTRRRDRLFVEH